MPNWHDVLTQTLPPSAVTHGNRLTLLTDGDAVFRQLWSDMEQAERRIWLETYVFDPDCVGRETRRRLVEAARRGCDVVVLYDSQGSPEMDAAFMEPLRTAGGTVIPYHPVYPWQKLARRLGNPLQRDHRKVVVIDDAVAYAGGRNVGDAYAGHGLGTGQYHDTQLRIEGPAVSAFARLFRHALHAASDLQRDVPAPIPPFEDGVCVGGADLDVPHGRKALHELLGRALDRARHRCYLTAGYFVAPPWLVRALCRAARRGVDVRVLTAGRSDMWVSRQAKLHTYGTLLAGGVQIYETYDRLLHAKDLVIDDAFSMVGSYNMDRWSLRHNLEMNAAALDEGLAGELYATFEQNLQGASRYTLARWQARSLPRRTLQHALYALMSL